MSSGMTTKAHEHWVSSLRPLLLHRGDSWDALSRRCDQIILFGSQAAGVQREGSDLDLLCIGSGKSHLSPAVDLVFVTLTEVKGSRWLGCELAGHVAHYGIWLKGEPDWVSQVRLSSHAIERKRDKILHRLRAVEERFQYLDASYLSKYLMLIRRDLQRYECLTNGEPVPPSPKLDQRWSQVRDTRNELRHLADQARIDSKFLLERLSIRERWSVDTRSLK